MRDTGRWIDGSGLEWFVAQREDGDIEANSVKGDYTAAYAKTWERWKSAHGWKPKDAPPKPSTTTSQ